MKGRRSVWRRTETLEQRQPAFNRWRTHWNLDALTDDELEALMPLAEKRAAAAPEEPVWTDAEMALMVRLWHKAETSRDTSPRTTEHVQRLGCASRSE